MLVVQRPEASSEFFGGDRDDGGEVSAAGRFSIKSVSRTLIMQLLECILSISLRPTSSQVHLLHPLLAARTVHHVGRSGAGNSPPHDGLPVCHPTVDDDTRPAGRTCRRTGSVRIARSTSPRHRGGGQRPTVGVPFRRPSVVASRRLGRFNVDGARSRYARRDRPAHSRSRTIHCEGQPGAVASSRRRPKTMGGRNGSRKLLTPDGRPRRRRRR